MANFVSVYKHMFGGQLFIRIFSFLLNFALLRLIDPSLLGFFNVKMTLLYNTICFLSREPIRRLCLTSDFPLHKVPLYASLSPLFALATVCLCCFPWTFLGPSPPAELAIDGPTNALIVAMFSVSAVVETFAEPSIVRQLKMGNTAKYAWNNAILVLSQKAIAFVAVLVGLGPILIFPMAQLIGSLLFLCIHFSSANPSNFLGAFSALRRIDLSTESAHLKLLGTFVCHSVLKQALTDGANYLMSFTDLLPLKMQAIYDAVERIASLVVRLVLQPFEESAAIYFGTRLSRAVDGTTGASGRRGAVPPSICAEFLLLIRLVVTLGFVLLPFGSSFCRLAAFLYGGQMFIDNGADVLLFWYSVYLPLIAVNGISECFVMSTLSAAQLFVHARFFLLLSVCLHFPLSYALCSLMGARGFVVANLAVYSLRVLFNWRFIHRTLGTVAASQFERDDGQKVMGHQSEIYRQLLPNKKFILLLLFIWFVLAVSHTFLGHSLTALAQIGHLLIGAAMFCLCSVAFFIWEYKPLATVNFGLKKVE